MLLNFFVLLAQAGREQWPQIARPVCRLCSFFLFFAFGLAWTPVNAQAIDSKTDLYYQAMLSITEGRLADAQAMLTELVVKEPRHAGAWLDLALLYCAAGNMEEVEKIFTVIESRFNPPQPIVDVIARQRKLGCAVAQPTHQGHLKLGRGRESNVNQGALDPNFTIGRGVNQVKLVLLPAYLPQSDEYSHFSANFSGNFSASGLTGLLQIQARDYDHLSAYDTHSVLVRLAQSWQAGPWAFRGSAATNWVMLDQHLYSGQQELMLEVQPPLALPPPWTLGITGALGSVSYPKVGGFDAQWRELRTSLGYRKGAKWFQGSFGFTQDQQRGLRPGGNRSGAELALQGQFDLGGETLFEAGWYLQRWRSHDAYFPGLIDERRAQNTRALRVAAVWPVARRQTVTVEFKDVRNDENISLFNYRNQVLQLGWQWSLGQ